MTAEAALSATKQVLYRGRCGTRAYRACRWLAEARYADTAVSDDSVKIGSVDETADDLSALQELLDSSYARAGSHLRSIWPEETRLDAPALCCELAGLQLVDLATVTPRGEPRVAPVDGLFFRGHLWFGSSETSQRFRNIGANPAVSAALTRGFETFLVIIHGRAVEIDPRGPDADGFARYPREVYDFDWDATYPTAPYARIDAHTLLAFKRS